MNVTKDGFKDRQLHMEDYLQMVSAEQKEYAEVSVYQRITENNDIITDFWTDNLLELILRKDNLNKAYKKVKSNKGKGGIHRARKAVSCTLDRGSQYCPLDYPALAKEHGFVSSMSRKGNCWDNAPMGSFWGKLKREWLNGQHFRTREEAKAAVSGYIWIFYNRKRIHGANGYLTPEEYYEQHQADLKAA